MYYLYHIPGKKIGVTRNLNTRVTLMQGYKEGEYEVLEQSDDIDYISDRNRTSKVLRLQEPPNTPNLSLIHISEPTRPY